MKKVLSQRFMLIVMCVLAAVGVLSAVFMAKSGDVQAGESLAPLDDAYIHLQFARNMVSGQGWSFNAGEPTAGSTAPLFTIVLTGLGCLLSSSMDWLWISRIAGITCHVMMIIIFFRWCCHRSYDLFASSLLSLSLCTTGALLWASVAGMEIALSSLLMAGCLMVHQSRTDTFDRPLLLGMLGGLCVLARPECLLLMLLILFDRCVVVEKHSHNGSPSLTCRLTWSHAMHFSSQHSWGCSCSTRLTVPPWASAPYPTRSAPKQDLMASP